MILPWKSSLSLCISFLVTKLVHVVDKMIITLAKVL